MRARFAPIAVLACMVLAGCGDDRQTALDVVVTESPAGALGGEVDELRLTVIALRDGGEDPVSVRTTQPILESGRVRPWTERVMPARADDAGRVLYRLTVEALRAGAVVVTTRARVTFLSGSVLTLPMRLEAECVGTASCVMDTTCRAGACVDDFVPACDLLERRPAECNDDPRVTMDAGLDASRPDLGGEDAEAGPIDMGAIDATVGDSGSAESGPVDSGPSDAGPDGAVCVAERDCAVLGRQCGEGTDECGAPLGCGDCTGVGETCGANEPFRCGVAVIPDVTPPECSAPMAACLAPGSEIAATCTDDRAVTGYECRAGPDAALPPFASCSMPWVLPMLAEGPARIEIRARDGAGNWSAAATVRVEIDGTPPQIEVGSPPRYTNDPRPTLSSIASDLGCGGAISTDCTHDGSSVSCLGLAPPGLADGDHTYVVTARDRAGNEATTTYVWTLDRVPPVVTVPAMPDAAPTDYDALVTAAFSWSCTDATSGCDGSSATCTVDAMSSGVTCGMGTGSLQVGVGATRPFGNHPLVVSMRDRAGNEASGTASLNVSRCAREHQLPNRASNGFWRGACCAGLVEADWTDFSGALHPRGDRSCRPPGDVAFRLYESVWTVFGPGASSGCATGLQRASEWGVSCGASSAGAMCLASLDDARVLCGADPPACTTPPCPTPFHGYAGEGWHGSRALGCATGSFATTGGIQARANNTDVCFSTVDLAPDGWSVSITQDCQSGLTRHCRDGAFGDAACVCTASPVHPYASDGHG